MASILDIIKTTGNAIKRKKFYRLKFNKEDDGQWYIDLPNWPFAHHNLMMVASADKLCDFLSNDGKHTYVEVIPETYQNDELQAIGYSFLFLIGSHLTGGATYMVEELPEFRRHIWLCPVTLFVLGKYPKYIYIKKLSEDEYNNITPDTLRN